MSTPETKPSEARVTRPSAWDLASAALFGTLLVVVAATYQDYGITWDETWHVNYGNKILEWFVTGGENTEALHYRADYLYGGAFDAGASWVRHQTRWEDYRVTHLFGACIGVLGIVGTWRLGRELAGPAGGFWSAAMLTITAPYYAHMFNNPKDLPFAVGYVWAMSSIVKLARRLPSVSSWLWLELGLTLGLAMSVRIAGLITVCFFALTLVVWVARRTILDRDLGALRSYLVHFTPRATGSVVLAWGIMVFAWPWAREAPLRRPLIALTNMSNFNLHRRTMPFDGEWIKTTEVPWDYLVHYFGYKLPEIVLLLAAASVLVLLGAWVWRRAPANVVRDRWVWTLLAASVLLPPAWAVYKSSPLYDGLRHFLFLCPILAVAAGTTLTLLMRWASRLHPAAAALPVALASGAIVDQVRIMKHLHPHEVVYFNRLIGGLPGADGKYSTDYYGNSYKEAFSRLHDHMWRSDPDRYLEEGFPISGCIPDFVARHYLAPNSRWIGRRGKREKPEFYLGYTRNKCHKHRSRYEVVDRVERFDTLLNVIRDLRKPRKGARRKARRE